MYFESRLSVDPSQLTKIEKKIPTKVFKRLLHHLSGGLIADKIERETFTAVAILQQLNRVFYNQGITNIIRLSHDDIDFYFDEEGKEDDLKEAFDRYDLETDHSMSQHFERLIMVLEHEDETFKHLIEIDINRNHKISVYPIEIKLSGFIKAFKAKSANSAKAKVSDSGVFKSQEDYDDYLRTCKQQFETFAEDLGQTVKKLIKIDDIKVEHQTRMVVPKDKKAQPQRHQRQERGYYGPHYGYFGFDEFLMYSFVWSSMCHDHSIHINNITIENETGEAYGAIGEEGLDTDSSFFDDNTDVGQSDFDNLGDTKSSGWDSFLGSDSDDGGWFSSDSFDSSCSSCSSCASCGGD